ncbi:MAG: MFS transporter, partial [Luminiphilus sp.]|nr:MFS transporter [Luminiphilus sp.]
MSHTKLQRWTIMVSLIMAGEAIFTLPYHVTRFFRPTVLEVFGLSATELGVAQAAYGVVAMVAYFFGGPLADRFSARKLLAVSLWLTALGGLYLATLPGYYGAMLVWGFFGLSTIFLFWAALIKATRSWGGIAEQGLAYGVLDGGRGLLAAVLASLGVLLFSLAFPEGYEVASAADKRATLQQIILGYTTVTALTGVMVWFTLRGLPETTASVHAPLFGHFWQVMRIPAVWLQTIVLVCAYTSYKAFDQYALFAVRGHGIDEIEAAQIVTLGAWTRPIAALILGLMADRFGVSKMTVVCFGILIISHSLFAFTGQAMGSFSFILANTVVTGIAIFGLRGLYFALFEEGRIPLAMTGTAIGVVSVIGYTPDVYVAAVAGYLIDNNPGL